MKAFGANDAGALPGSASAEPSASQPIIRPPPKAALASGKASGNAALRSFMHGAHGGPHCPRGGLRRLLDGLTDAHVGSAAADVAGHALIDVGVGRLWDQVDDRGRAHDLAGLAVAALHDLQVEPRLLHGLAGRSRANAFDGGDLAVGDVR